MRYLYSCLLSTYCIVAVLTQSRKGFAKCANLCVRKGFTQRQPRFHKAHKANDPLTTQRSLIKEYEPKRKNYRVFYKIDIAPFLKGAISIVAVKYYWTMNLPERVVLAVMNWYR